MVSLKQVGANVPRFGTRLNKTSFGITANVTVQPGAYGKVGELTVGKQQLATFGKNAIHSGGIQGEPIFIDLRDASDVAVNGSVRLSIYDANDRLLRVVVEERTERLRASQNDITLAPLLAEFALFAPEDVKLRIELYPDGNSAVTLGYASTNFYVLVPVTKVFL